MAAVVISPVNRKGGVGKSSSVFHLGGYFASQGLRVLLIDNEPQHSLTNGLIGPDAAAALDPAYTTAALFDLTRQPTPETLIRQTTVKNIDLVCGSDALDQVNGPPEEKPVE
ncbi:MAG: ParA family protein, partial [Planctomycetales bacterium]|nr:ParA family protein [Planctomycetales bacterium]